jgi:hypothetical protein
MIFSIAIMYFYRMLIRDALVPISQSELVSEELVD